MIPGVSSERRQYIPIGFMTVDVIASNLVFVVPDATLYHFGILTSTMHMVWMRFTCGRLESRYRYSKDIVYNNYPWPESVSEKRRKIIETGAQRILDARNTQDGTLAELYDPLLMPKPLLDAHRALDREVEKAYTKKKFGGDADRVEFLFDRYREISSPLRL